MVTKRLTLKKQEELVETKLAEVYMVMVAGRGEPTKFHFDIVTASQEAKRLAEKEAPRLVSLLKVMCCWQGKVRVEDVDLPQPSITA